MPTIQPMDFDKDMKNHPEISQLLRVIMTADPLAVAEGKNYVIIGGPDDQFKFTKSGGGYTVEKTK